MSKFVKTNRVSLKNHPSVNETDIQQYIFDDPSVLGLGQLSAKQREKKQDAGGRLDILLADDEGGRYEVEIQLGATDPSHIIRTIEYWDNEKRKYPDYNHTAVIVAEEITGRFLNVISLFNGSIPLIAIQMSAYKIGDELHLAFTKVLDRVSRSDDDDAEAEIADRSFWEKKGSKASVALVEAIVEKISAIVPGIVPKYNKPYIGITINGNAKNFVQFKPKKSFLAFFIRANENTIEELDTGDLDIDYINRIRSYRVRMKSIEEYENNREIIEKLICEARDLYNIDVET